MVVPRRALSGSAVCFKRLGIAETFKQVSKPPLTESIAITKPFGVKKGTTLTDSKGKSVGLDYKLLSTQARERRQRELKHDLVHSPIYESQSYNNTKGKIFTSPAGLFQAKYAQYFPDFTAETLTGNLQQLYGLLPLRLTFVRIYSTMSGEQCVDSWFKRDGKDYLDGDYAELRKEYPHLQFVDINMPQGMIKGMIVKWSKNGIKAKLPKERHNQYYIVPQSLFSLEVKEELFCDNACSGYIYLLDQEGRIRWAASGPATEKEVGLMWKVVAQAELGKRKTE